MFEYNFRYSPAARFVGVVCRSTGFSCPMDRVTAAKSRKADVCDGQCVLARPFSSSCGNILTGTLVI